MINLNILSLSYIYIYTTTPPTTYYKKSIFSMVKNGQEFFETYFRDRMVAVFDTAFHKKQLKLMDISSCKESFYINIYIYIFIFLIKYIIYLILFFSLQLLQQRNH